MDAINKLIAGFHRFREHYYVARPELIAQLVKQGQSPQTLVIACCDSRVNPAMVLNTEPGDIFVIRNVANIVPPCEDDGKSHHGTGAAIEFAVKHLGVKHIIVFGHSQCGGIRSLMEGRHAGSDYGFIDPWMSILASAQARILKEFSGSPFDDQCHQCELAGIEVSLDNICSFPWIKNKMDQGALYVHGWYFNIGAGELLRKDLESGEFVPVDHS